MNKALLVIGVASIAGAAFILVCTLYPPLGALFVSGKTFVLGLLGQAQAFVTTNPFTTPIAGAVGTGITYLAMSARASKASAAANQTQNNIINQADAALTEQNGQIISLKTQIDNLNKKVQETAQLKTEITSLQTKLSAAEQEAQRVRDEYNALIRIRAVAESLPVPESAVH
jgi:hypothetical protein